MNELIGTINQFFKKISKNHIQFHLSEHYTIHKKQESQVRGRHSRKENKDKMEGNL